VTDDRLRELERRFQETGAAEDEAAWLRARVRAGEHLTWAECVSLLAVDPATAGRHLAARWDTHPPRRVLSFGDLSVVEALAPTSATHPAIVLHLSGPFDGLEETERLLGYFERFLDEQLACPVVVDMSEVTYYSDLGPSCLARLAEALDAEGWRLAIAAPSPPVSEVLGLLEVAFHASVSAALADVARPDRGADEHG